MGAQVEHDDVKTGLCQPFGMAIFDPIDRRRRKQAMKQQQRATMPPTPAPCDAAKRVPAQPRI
jgi:hypothetical protein